ncbi:MAG: zinc ribbon domain-containing protein [Acidobacteria bacterium]|nr:zinc ribbon domain-containing protein [Acidobacteriota bacterium]
MPIFEYECKKCGARMEKLVRNGNEPEVVCEKCGGEVTKLISSPMIQFKGSGWYITDYQNKEKRLKSKDEGSTASSMPENPPKKEDTVKKEAKAAQEV